MLGPGWPGDPHPGPSQPPLSEDSPAVPTACEMGPFSVGTHPRAQGPGTAVALLPRDGGSLCAEQTADARLGSTQDLRFSSQEALMGKHPDRRAHGGDGHQGNAINAFCLLAISHGSELLGSLGEFAFLPRVLRHLGRWGTPLGLSQYTVLTSAPEGVIGRQATGLLGTPAMPAMALLCLPVDGAIWLQ